MTLLERLQRDGIRRVGTPKRGFHYLWPDGRPVAPARRRELEALKLPPAWAPVFISPSPRAHLLAVGRDRAGRWQYRYHPGFLQRQQAHKYERVLEFAQALPTMRATVQRHLRQDGLGRERVMACILRILSTCFIRPGSQAYADENGSYGIATLRPAHVKVVGDRVQFRFPGKGQKLQEREVVDAQVARTVRQLLRIPGKELFKYLDEQGRAVDVKRRDINQYIKEVMGERFTAKDFRTWAGTLVAASALARAGVDPMESARQRKRKVAQAVREAAAVLGNTPAICRASYIYPSVLSSFDRGRVVTRFVACADELARHRPRGMLPPERALLELLSEPRATSEGSRRAPLALAARKLGAKRSAGTAGKRRRQPSNGSAGARRRGTRRPRRSRR
jgi:DNA topoisomerase I